MNMFKKNFLSIVLSVLLSGLLVFTIARAATTISTNISTGGTLTVTGLTSLSQASSTRISIVDTAYFGGSATSTFNSAGTLTMAANIVSDTDSTDNLGLTGTRWAATFSDNFTGNTITLDGGTGVNVLTVTNNVSDALSIVDSSGDLLVFDTTTGSEVVTFSPRTSFATTSTANLTQGGGVYATTTTVATETITGDILEDYNVIRFLGSATAAAMTATIEATSSWPATLLPNPGDRKQLIVENGYTAAATTTTIAAGAGVDLQEPDGQNVVIDINNYAWLDCFREASTDVVCLVNESIPAD